MTKRNNHSRNELKEMAVNAAEKMIDAQGLKGLSARKVAAEIGCAVGTLYLIFKNIDALIMAVNVRTLEQMEAMMPDSCDQYDEDDPTKSIEKMARSYMQYAVTHSPRWLAVFEHHLPKDEVLSDDYQAVATRLLMTVEKRLGLLHPTFDDERIKVEARALWASVHGLCSLTVGDKLNRVRSVEPAAVANVLLQRFMGKTGGEL